MPGKRCNLCVVMNGQQITVFIEDELVLECCYEAMGGQELVGFGGNTWKGQVYIQKIEYETVQDLMVSAVEKENYVATVRPGNVGEIYFKHSSNPNLNICCDSGIQFGHIGASEIRQDLSAMFEMQWNTLSATSVCYSGRMPYHVDRHDDIRGKCRGRVSFYSDRIVIADFIVPTTTRSVGPDLDTLAKAAGTQYLYMTSKQGPQLRTANEHKSFVYGPKEPFPYGIQQHMKLGDISGLISMIVMKLDDVGPDNNILFDKYTDDGVTLSVMFREAPAIVGKTYRFGITAFIDITADGFNADLLQQYYDDVCNPMKRTFEEGRFIDPNEDVLLKNRWYNSHLGLYELCMDQSGVIAAQIDVESIKRYQPIFGIHYGVTGKNRFIVKVDDQLLSPQTDYLLDQVEPGRWIMQLKHEFPKNFCLKIE